MRKEFDFYIKEQDSQIIAWAKMKKRQGSILVGNAEQVIEELEKRTSPGDLFDCTLAGGWLDQCVEKSVRRLLKPVGYGLYLRIGRYPAYLLIFPRA